MKTLDPYTKFEDNRGLLLGIVNSGYWEEINYVETQADQVRGGHYHKETREMFFIIDGEIEIRIDDINGKNIRNFSARKGSIFVVEPFEVHTFMCKTKSSWINILSKRMDTRASDIHRPDNAGA